MVSNYSETTGMTGWGMTDVPEGCEDSLNSRRGETGVVPHVGREGGGVVIRQRGTPLASFFPVAVRMSSEFVCWCVVLFVVSRMDERKRYGETGAHFLWRWWLEGHT